MTTNDKCIMARIESAIIVPINRPEIRADRAVLSAVPCLATMCALHPVRLWGVK